MSKPKILVFASGTLEGGGSGLEELVKASRTGILDAVIIGVVCNIMGGGVHERAKRLDIPFYSLAAGLKWEAKNYAEIANHTGADFFALSGWLKLVRGLYLNSRFNSRTVFNIHPGPLPDFGGKGMFGHHVHEAVMAAYRKGKLAYSAVCMHYVTEEYDRGPVFFRQGVEINQSDTAESLGARLNRYEHLYQPIITNLVVNGKIQWDGVDPKSLTYPSDYSINHRVEG